MSGETEEKPSGWTVDTALQTMKQMHDDLIVRVDERAAAQQVAMTTAFAAADKAVAAALESAEKAVIKAEYANEKRFEAVNEFRQTLTDQTATFMPRAEAEARVLAVSEKLDTHAVRTDQRLAEVVARLDTTAGRTDGGEARQAKQYAALGAVGAFLGIVLSVIALFSVLQK